MSNIGSNNTNAKLNEEKVKAILRSKGKITGRELGDIYQVDFSVIYKIWRGEIWKHVSI